MIVKIRLNQNLSTPNGKKLKDQIIKIECAPDGVPLDRFWRNRFTDSKIDNCLEIVKEDKQKQINNENSNINKKNKK